MTLIVRIAVNKLTKPSDIKEAVNKNCKNSLFNKSKENNVMEINLWKLEMLSSIKNNKVK
jgi:hypothetical protein